MGGVSSSQRFYSAAIPWGKLYMLKDYKINPNEFKVTTNLIYLVLNLVLFALFHSLPAIKFSLVSMQHNLSVKTPKTKETLQN